MFEVIWHGVSADQFTYITDSLTKIFVLSLAG